MASHLQSLLGHRGLVRVWVKPVETRPSRLAGGINRRFNVADVALLSMAMTSVGLFIVSNKCYDV